MRLALTILLNDGAATPAMIAAIAIVTSSSISEKPRIAPRRRAGVLGDGCDGRFMVA